MALKDFEGPGTVLLDSDLLVHAKSVRAQFSPKNNDVMTFAGYVGTSAGPFTTTLQITLAVLKNDPQVSEIIAGIIARKKITVVMVYAGKRYQFDATYDEASANNETDSPAEFSFGAKAGKPLILDA